MATLAAPLHNRGVPERHNSLDTRLCQTARGNKLSHDPYLMRWGCSQGPDGGLRIHPSSTREGKDKEGRGDLHSQRMLPFTPGAH